MSEPLLDEEAKAIIRDMTDNGRAVLRKWFADEPHYYELIEYLDTLKGKTDVHA